MASRKISELTDGGALQDGDAFPAARAGANVRVSGAEIRAALGGSQTAPARGCVMWHIDDGRSDAPSIVSIHDRFRQKVTLGIVSDLIGTTSYMAAGSILALHQAGHEIANHSKTHTNYTTLTAAQRRVETDTCNSVVAGITGVTPQTFIYPQGAWNTTTDRELYGTFRSWGATVSDTTGLPIWHSLGDTDPRYYRVDLSKAGNFYRAYDLIQLAATTPIIVAFYVHYLDNDSITTANYTALAQLVYSLGVPSVLPRDTIGGLSWLVDHSFERAGLPAWLTLCTGSGTYGQQTGITPDAGIAGTGALSLTASNPDTAGVSQALPMIARGIVGAASKVRVSGRVKNVSGNLTTNDFGVRLKYRNWDETALSAEVFFPTVPALGSWTRFEQDFTVPDGCRFAYLDLLNIPGSTRSGTVYVDHVDIRPISQGGLG